MKHTSVQLESPIELVDIVPLNPYISKCQIKVCYVGDEPNRNHSIITKDVAKQMANSLPGCPIVGYYSEEKEDFTDHSKFLEIKEILPSLLNIGIIGILLAVSIFLISNTVMIGIAVRKDEIAIMKYVGATDFFVRSPFVIEGIIIGAVGSLIPLAVIYLMYNKVIEYVVNRFTMLSSLISFLPVNDIFYYLVPTSIGLGIGIGFFGSIITVRKHLRV